MTATGAFATSLLTSFAIFCGLVVAFTVLSKWKSNYNVYFPSRMLAGTGPPSPSANCKQTLRTGNAFAWLKEAIVTPQAELVRVAGLDAAVYLNFFTTGPSSGIGISSLTLNPARLEKLLSAARVVFVVCNVGKFGNM